MANDWLRPDCVAQHTMWDAQYSLVSSVHMLRKKQCET